MALPTNRTLFKEYCLRRLGFPVIEINVDDEQLEDRIDDALSYFHEYHYDGLEHTYYKYRLTAADISNRYIVLPDEIMSVVKIVPGSLITSGQAIFDVGYQMAMNEYFDVSSKSLIGYYLTQRHLELFSEFFSGIPGIRFNKKTNKLYIDQDWREFSANDILVFEAYVIVDPAKYAAVWKDRWLLRYATALMKRQWGENMKKFSGIQLLGGNVMSGQEIYSEAVEELTRLEEQMMTSYSLPPMDQIG